MGDLFLTDGAFWLTVLAVGLACVQGGRGPLRQAWLLVLSVTLLAWVLPTRSVSSFGVSLLVIAAIYQLRPYRSWLPLLALPLLSPFARYLDAVLGFELRLGLSAAAGRFFRMLGREVTVRGSDLVLDGRQFGVDASCAGLHMLLTGLATALLLLAVGEWRLGRVLRLWPGVGVLAATVALVLLSNLTRIVVLVERGWGPEHALHTWVGLACFGVYVLLPLAVGIPLLLRQDWAVYEPDALVSRSLNVANLGGRLLRRRPAILFLIAACGLSLLSGFSAFAKTRDDAAAGSSTLAIPATTLAGQIPELRAHDVLAYQFSDALVYRKPIAAWYKAEHSPLICWRGSGYEIVDVRVEQLPNGAGSYYRGTLRRGDERLHTAWWMSNGEHATIEQGVWRGAMLRGEKPFALVNVTTAGDGDLACWVLELME